jgi:hypothetical protein
MDTFDISQLKPEEVRNRPAWYANPWLGVIPLALLAAVGTALLLVLGATSASWAAGVMGLLLGVFYGWREWRRGEQVWALRAALRRQPRGMPWEFWVSFLGVAVVFAWSSVLDLPSLRYGTELCLSSWCLGWGIPLSVLEFRAWPQAWRIIREVKARGTPSVPGASSQPSL